MCARLFCVIFLCLLSYTNLANPFIFKEAGFTIEALDAPAHQSGSQPLTMLLPNDQGFSANVNVQIHSFNGGLNQYKTMSLQHFKQLDISLIKETLNEHSLTMEYVGEVHGRLLHWYAKALKRGNFVYLATATSLEINWQQNKFELIQSINSFQLL